MKYGTSLPSLLLCLFFVSCNTRETAMNSEVVLTPTVLDFGRVRADAEPVELSFCIENKGKTALTIEKILPGCGCTLCELPSETIPPNDSVTANVKVFLEGRAGEFAHEIWVKMAGAESFQYLPIRGFIDDTLSFSGQTVRCTANPSGRIAETQFAVKVKQLSDLKFNAIFFPEGVTAKELKQEPTQDGFVLQMALRIQVPEGLEFYDFDLVLQPTDKTILPLTVPVQCYVEKQRP